MATTTAGSEKYTSGYSNEALKAQMAKTPEKQAPFLLPYLKPGLSVLDCGCGAGGLSLGFARLVSPGGRVEGVDLEEKVVQTAKECAEAAELSAVANFQKASVYELPFEDETFDVVIGVGLILYLSEPLRGLREMLRVLKPGGILGLVSTDLGGWLYAPETPGLVAALKFYEKLMARNGGDAHCGRKLQSMTAEIGLELTHVGYKYDHTTMPPKGLAGFLLSHVKDSVEKEDAIGKGWTTQAEVDEMLSALEEYRANPDALLALALVEVAARKPVQK